MDNKALTVTATIVANATQRNLVKTELLKLLELSRAEEGCIMYNLFQDTENPNAFFVYSSWINRAYWKLHLSQPYVKQYLKGTSGVVQGIQVNQLNRLA